MSDQLSLQFNPSASRAARDAGIDRATAALSRIVFLEEARDVAREIARRCGDVDADDVVKEYAQYGVDISLELGNAMGALFRGREWEWTGQVRNSERVGRHASAIRVWRLRG